MRATVMNPAITVDQAKAFFIKKKVMILDPQKSMKITLKKILFGFGIELKDMLFVEGSFEEAIKEMSIHRPEIIFTPYTLSDKTVVDIYLHHEGLYPNRLDAAFFVLSTDNSLATASIALDYDIDAFLAEPFTMTSITETIQESLRPKLLATPFDFEYSRAMVTLKEGKIEQAKELSNVLNSIKGARFDKAVHFQGLCAFEEANFGEAIKYFKQSDTIKPDAYRNLKALAKSYNSAQLWTEAYETHRKLIEKFPLGPERIPELIKLAVLNKRYDDIFFFYDFFHKLEVQDKIIKRHISAGLAICGKFLLETGKKKKGIEAIRLSAEYSEGSLEILKSIIPALLKAGVFSNARELLMKYHDELGEINDYKILELEILSQSANKQKEALAFGYRLLRSGVIETEVYTTVLSLSYKLKRNPKFIADLLNDAIHKLPESKQIFEDLQKKFNQ